MKGAVSPVFVLYGILLGIAVAAAFELCRFIRAFLPSRTLMTALFDILFWLFSAVFIWFYSLAAFKGSFTLAPVLSAILSFLIFLLLFDRMFRRFRAVAVPKIRLFLRGIASKCKRGRENFLKKRRFFKKDLFKKKKL